MKPLIGLVQQNLQVFEQIFKEYFPPLCGFAMKYVKDQDAAKSLVHEVFISVWEKFQSLPADIHYKSYLYTAVRNRCFNHLRDQKKHVIIDSVAEDRLTETQTLTDFNELSVAVEKGLELLPEKCRQIFELNRMEGLKYAEIAEKLNLSVKTVEAQMSKALSILREHLAEFLSLLLIFLFFE